MTDSLYVYAEPLLKHLYPDFESFSEEEKENILEKIAHIYQNVVTKSYDKLALECFNTPQHKFEMKTEVIIRSAYFRSTRRYAQWITKEKGRSVQKLDIKGLEFKKSNFPPILGEFFEEVLVDVLKGAKEEEIVERVKALKNQVLTGEIPILKLGNPVAVKTLNFYIGKKAEKDELFSIAKKGAPAPVKAAIIYNDLLKYYKLNGKHSYISNGDKIKWLYMKSNSLNIKAIAYLDFDLPERILKFMEQYVDRQHIFDSIILNKIEGFFEDLGWELSLNKYKEEFFDFN